MWLYICCGSASRSCVLRMRSACYELHAAIGVMSSCQPMLCRAPLSQKDLMDDTELKARIQQWMQEQRSK